MANGEEHLRILHMVADGRITVEEGARLLETLPMQEAPGPPSLLTPPRWLQRATDLGSGRDRVNIDIPVGLVDVGLKMGARFIAANAGIDPEELTKAVHRRGRLFEVENPAEGGRVEIFLECATGRRQLPACPSCYPAKETPCAPLLSV